MIKKNAFDKSLTDPEITVALISRFISPGILLSIKIGKGGIVTN